MTARRGRPPGTGRPAAELAGERVRVYLTPAELATLDAIRGDASRSEHLARPVRAGWVPLVVAGEIVGYAPAELAARLNPAG